MKQRIARRAAELTAQQATEDGSDIFVLACDANLPRREFMDAIAPLNFGGSVGTRRDFVAVQEGHEHAEISRRLPVFDSTDHLGGAIGLLCAATRRRVMSPAAEAAEEVESLAAAVAGAVAVDGDATDELKGASLRAMREGLDGIRKRCRRTLGGLTKRGGQPGGWVEARGPGDAWPQRSHRGGGGGRWISGSLFKHEPAKPR